MPDLTTSSPTVLGFRPGLDATNVSAVPLLEILFSGDMLQGSLNTDLAVNRGMSLFEVGNDVQIPLGFVDYNSLLKTLVVKPTETLSVGAKYLVLVESKSNGFLGISGRPIRVAKTFDFYVTQAQLPEVTSLLPVIGAVCDYFPTLTINVPVFTPPSSGAITFVEFQLSSVEGFDDPFRWEGSYAVSGSGVVSILPNVSLSTDKTYYWRARLVAGLVSGPYTPTNNFYYGSRLQANQDSQRNREEDTLEFGVKAYGFEDSSANLNSWPDITYVFNKPVESTLVSGSLVFNDSLFKVTGENVDGGPQLIVAGVWIMSDTQTIKFYPEGQINNLTRYTVSVRPGLKASDGSYLKDIPTLQFTGPYRPLYALPVQLRAIFGSLVDNISDDYLCFHLYRASLDANYKARIQPMVQVDPFYFFSGPSTQQLRGDNYDFLYAVHMWVITYAMIRVLNTKLYETVPAADGRLQIGDFSQNLSSVGLLQFLQNKIKDLKHDLREYEMRFSRQATRPRTGQKASATPLAYQYEMDAGYSGRKGF